MTFPPYMSDISLFKRKKVQQTFREHKKRYFFRPDYTVATGVTHGSAILACGVYRRLGISPDPEVLSSLL